MTLDRCVYMAIADLNLPVTLQAMKAFVAPRRRQSKQLLLVWSRMMAVQLKSLQVHHCSSQDHEYDSSCTCREGLFGPYANRR